MSRPLLLALKRAALSPEGAIWTFCHLPVAPLRADSVLILFGFICRANRPGLMRLATKLHSHAMGDKELFGAWLYCSFGPANDFSICRIRTRAPWDGVGVILSLIELKPVPGNRESILQLLQFCVDSAKTRPGCLGSAIYEAGEEHGTILYLERWRSEKGFHRHIQSKLYREILNAMDLAEEPREFTFHEVTETKSLELVVALRKSTWSGN
jgi:quinol monooxygenase YgiN